MRHERPARAADFAWFYLVLVAFLALAAEAIVRGARP
jgi:hypothetical protein